MGEGEKAGGLKDVIDGGKVYDTDRTLDYCACVRGNAMQGRECGLCACVYACVVV